MRLGKYIAVCGLASRRRAVDLVRSGQVRVNGEIEDDPARELSDADLVTVSGSLCVPPAEQVYILLHKPRGYVCSSADAHAEFLAVDLIDLPGIRLFSAGRLDKDSEGAIIFSNDGDFVAKLTHPRYEVLKLYDISTDAELPPDAGKKMLSGIADDGEVLRVRQFSRLGHCHYQMLLNEGRKREVRRLTAACGAVTVRLRRLAVGNVALGNLPAGKWRYLTAGEVESLKQSFNNIS